jgi:hypothetical protein
MGMANPRIVRLTTTRPSKSRPAPDPSPTTHPARRSPGALTHAHLTNRRPYQSSCPVRTTGRPSRIRVRSRERGRVPARANPTTPLRVGPFELSARSAVRRRPACRPRPGVPGRKSERARHSPVVARVWPYLVDRAQDHFAVWEAVIAIVQREDRPIEAHSVGRGQQVDEARQVQRTVCPGPPARVGHVRASRAPTSLKRRCVEPQQRAGGKLSRPRVPLAGSCRPPTGFDQSRGRRAVAETCQPTAPPLVLA